MSLCFAERIFSGLPDSEVELNGAVTLRLVQTEEDRVRHDELMESDHYLHNCNAVGTVLKYVAEVGGQWVAALTFCSSALHLKPRDRLLHWSAREVSERRHLIAQNSRFLLLPSTGRWPNLASRVLTLAGERLPEDWRKAFGYPALLAETFVDPQRFRGTCYKAAGWQALGETQGFKRRGQDFYTETKHPKELWVCPLGPGALEQLRAPELAPELQSKSGPPPPKPPIATRRMESLWEFVHAHSTDPRKRRGVRHKIASIVCLATLAIAAGCQGPHAVCKFAESLNHGQRRLLRCWPRKDARGQYDVPCERTFRRLFETINPEELLQVFAGWMAHLDPEPVSVLHLDGKVLRNADAAPERLKHDAPLAQAAAALDTPPETQKPKAEKALTLVNFQTPGQRLIGQIAVPQDTNEEAAVAAHLPNMDLAGVIVIADAAHTVKANCRLLTQDKGAEYIFLLKGNQPQALAKAEQILFGDCAPQARTIDKGHGRIEERQIRIKAVDGATLGLAGAAQVFRIDRHTTHLRKGEVTKTTAESAYGVASLSEEEAGPERILRLVREYWAIEIKQHYRRDHTQREDHCQVRATNAARNLSLMRTMAIFLYEQQRHARAGEKSLPDWQRKNIRNPTPLIQKMMGPALQPSS